MSTKSVVITVIALAVIWLLVLVNKDRSLTASLGTETRSARIERLLDAMRIVETGGEPNEGIGAIGPCGELGPYQIGEAYWCDAVERWGDLAAREWKDCLTDPEYAREIVRAYWLRWCQEALVGCDLETLARVHNGGPEGPMKSSTDAYVAKVRKAMEAKR